MVRCLHVQPDLFVLVLAGEGGDLGGVEGCDVVGDGLDGLQLEVDIVNAQLVVEPDGLGVDELLGNPSAFADMCSDCEGC